MTESNIANYTLEFCPFCEADVIIFAKGVTGCPECGAPLAPCSVCEACSGQCPYGCTGGEEDAHKAITNPPITQEEITWAQSRL